MKIQSINNLHKNYQKTNFGMYKIPIKPNQKETDAINFLIREKYTYLDYLMWQMKKEAYKEAMLESIGRIEIIIGRQKDFKKTICTPTETQEIFEKAEKIKNIKENKLPQQELNKEILAFEKYIENKIEKSKALPLKRIERIKQKDKRYNEKRKRILEEKTLIDKICKFLSKIFSILEFNSPNK